MPPATSHAFVRRLGPEQRKLFERNSQEFRVPRGHVVIGQGAKSTDVFLILEGRFQVLIYSKSGKEVSIRTIGKDDVFGELAAFVDGRRSANVVALTEGRLAQIGGAHFKRCAETSPAAAMWLVERFAGQVRALTERIFELSALNVRSRVLCEVMRLVIIAGVADNRAVIDPSPTDQEIANRIGSYREGVARAMGTLRDLGLISRKGRLLIIRDVATLARVVSEANAEFVGVLPAPQSDADLPLDPKAKDR